MSSEMRRRRLGLDKLQGQAMWDRWESQLRDPQSREDLRKLRDSLLASSPLYREQYDRAKAQEQKVKETQLPAESPLQKEEKNPLGS